MSELNISRVQYWNISASVIMVPILDCSSVMKHMSGIDFCSGVGSKGAPDARTPKTLSPKAQNNVVV